MSGGASWSPTQHSVSSAYRAETSSRMSSPRVRAMALAIPNQNPPKPPKPTPGGRDDGHDPNCDDEGNWCCPVHEYADALVEHEGYPWDFALTVAEANVRAE